MWFSKASGGGIVYLLIALAAALTLAVCVPQHVGAQEKPAPLPKEEKPESPPYERVKPPQEPAIPQPVEISEASKIEAKARVFEGKGLYGEAVSAYKEALETAIALAKAADKENAQRYWAEAEIYLDRTVSLMYQEPRPDYRKACRFLKTLGKRHKLPGVIGALARWKLARAFIRTGQVEKARGICRELGFVNNWMVIGPFQNERGGYFDVSYGPQTELDYDAAYDGKKRKVRWRMRPLTPVLGEVNFDAMMRPNDEVLAYALAFVEVPKATGAALRIGSDEGLKVWVNDYKVLSRDIHRRMGFDQDVVGVMLNKGLNKILVKVAERNGDWGFRLRITAPDGSRLAFAPLKTREEFENATYKKMVVVETELDPNGKKKVPVVEVDRGAIGYYEMIVKETPHDQIAQAHYGYIHLVHPFDDENAYKDRTAFEKCIELDPRNPYYHYMLAEAYESQVRIEAEKEGNKARQMTEKAIELEPEYVEALYSLARYYLDEMRNWRKARSYLDRALKVNPSYHLALLVELDILSARNFRIEEKLRTLALKRHPKKGVRTSPQVLRRLVRIYDGEHKPHEMLEILRRSIKQDYAAYWARSRLISYLISVGHLDKVLEQYEIIAQIDPYDISQYVARAGIYEGSDEFEKAIKEMDRALEVCPEAEDEMIKKAQLLMRLSLEKGEEIEGKLSQHVPLPEGRAVLEQEAPIYAQALAILEKVRRINPNNVWLKRYLEFLQEEKKSYEEHERLAAEVEVKPDDGIYIKSKRLVLDEEGKPVRHAGELKLQEHVTHFSNKELEAQAKGANLPFICVLSKQVTDVHKDGTASEFTHFVIKIFTEEGTERFMYFPTTAFMTSWRQEIKVKKARVIHEDGTEEEGRAGGWGVSFPPLKIGDTLDVQFRIDDTLTDLSERFFGDYYGKVHIFHNTIYFSAFFGVIAPIKLSEYYLMLPKERKFYFKTLNYPLAAKQRGTDAAPAKEPGITDSSEMVIFRLRDLGHIVPEFLMPPPDQFLPALQVSSFGDWKEFGKWFYNLIKKQYDTSPEIKEKVKELTSDKETSLDKIRAIYNFVVTDIRYEAWTYGIHGWQPYKASTIFARKQGDCKDKALLINTMLKEIGITSLPVLIQASAQRGEHDMTLPMVRHFNHCIAYVPPTRERKEGIWLDGTAQYYGMTDGPPFMDWSATTLVVDEDGGRLIRAPLPDPDKNTQFQNMVVEVLASGAAKVRTELTVTRDDAADVRRLFSVEGRSEIVLERLYGASFSGTKVRACSFPDLKDLNLKSLTYSYELEIPDYLKKTPEGLSLTHDFFEVPWSRLTPQAQRKYPYILPYRFGPAPILPPMPGTLKVKVTFILPEGFEVVSVPESREFESQFADFKLTWVVPSQPQPDKEDSPPSGGPKVFVEKMLRVKRNNLSIQQYARLRELTNLLLKAQKEKVTIKGPREDVEPPEVEKEAPPKKEKPVKEERGR